MHDTLGVLEASPMTCPRAGVVYRCPMPDALCFEVHLRRRGTVFAIGNGEEPIEGVTTSLLTSLAMHLMHSSFFSFFFFSGT